MRREARSGKRNGTSVEVFFFEHKRHKRAHKLGLLLCFFCTFCGSQLSLLQASDLLPKNSPIFFELRDEWEQVHHSSFAFSFNNPDTIIRHDMYLLFDSLGNPLMFYADILSPVCIDGLCKPVYIELYWNLIGEYVGYGVYPGEKLTKFDHELFEEQDYKKLHELLANPYSILDRKEMSDLYTGGVDTVKRVTYKGVEVDAVSGATKVEIKESVVEGALYSCFTLWHLVYGDAKRQIKAFIQKTYEPGMGRSLLASSYPNYQYFAVKQMSPDSLAANMGEILPIVLGGKPLVRSYILKKLPKKVFQDEITTQKLYQAFPGLDVGTRTRLVGLLPHSHPKALEILSNHIPSMTRNMLKDYLDQLSENRSTLGAEIMENLQKVVDGGEYSYGYIVREYLEKW